MTNLSAIIAEAQALRQENCYRLTAALRSDLSAGVRNLGRALAMALGRFSRRSSA